MAGSPGRWLSTPLLIGILSAATSVLAQTERPWIDPPSEIGTASSPPATPAPAAQPPQAAAPEPSTPQQPSASAPPQVTRDKEAVASPSPVEASAPKEASDERVKQKTVTERKVRRSPQQARNPTRLQRREEQAARRREPGVEVSQARPPRSGIERRARVMRYGSVQEGIDAGLQVMRLRTIQLPDGRRIEILTRPDHDIAGELPDEY